MTFAALFAIVVGVLIFGQWAFFLATKQVPELKTEPTRIRFHIVDESITAGLLMATGIGVLAESDIAVKLYPVALGMLLYTVIVSAGYFAQKHVWAIVGMFAIILVLAIVSLALFFQSV
jgi:hypothetical protein